MITSARDAAVRYFLRGYEAQSLGDAETALDFYHRSIVAYPTPEAYTFRGWAYSVFGDYDRAMFECFQAIKLDPDFGNPYDDIGNYMIKKERWDEAIEWFERAIEAKRYASRWRPYFNLGRVYEHKHDWAKAKAYYAQALAIDQCFTAARAGMARMRARLN